MSSGARSQYPARAATEGGEQDGATGLRGAGFGVQGGPPTGSSLPCALCVSACASADGTPPAQDFSCAAPSLVYNSSQSSRSFYHCAPGLAWDFSRSHKGFLGEEGSAHEV